MIAIVCDTPYQLMSAVLCAQEISKDEQLIFFINSYLYLKEQKFDYSDKHKAIYKICYYGRKHMGGGKLIAGLINPLNMLKHIEGYDASFDITAIISSRTTYIATYLYDMHIKKNPQLKLYLVEEGIGEYTGSMVHTRFTKACAMLKKKTHMDHVFCAYFSAPKLYPYKTYFEVKKVPKINENSASIIDGMFNLENFDNILEGYSCILLTDPTSIEMNDENLIKEYEERENDILENSIQGVGKENLIIKVHPIDPDFKCESVKTFYSKLPMESLVFKMDCNKKIFISSTSTAMLTPKLLFNQEPYLVFTYKILDKYLNSFIKRETLNRYYAFIEGVMGMYENKEKCFSPKTVNELKDVLNNIMEAFGNCKQQ